MSHTEGKLTLFSKNGTTAILDENGRELVAWMGFDRSERSKSEHKANARRLVACWNACDSIPTKELEAEGDALIWIDRVASRNAELIKDCAGLVDALRDMAEKIKRCDYTQARSDVLEILARYQEGK